MKSAAFFLTLLLGLSTAFAQVSAPPSVIPKVDFRGRPLVASDYAKPMAPATLLPLSGQPCKVGSGIFKFPAGNGDARLPLAVVTRLPSEMLSGRYVANDIVNVPYVYTSEDQLKAYLIHAPPKNMPYAETLRRPAVKAFIAMADAAALEGISIKVHSAYRAYDTQCGTFNKKFGDEFKADPKLILGDIDDEMAVARDVNTRSAFPGSSEHQLGTALDIVTDIPGLGWKLEPEMDQTPAFAWLQANAYKFGFVLSYPKGPDGPKSVNPRTGYVYEPWHWRYIGPVPAARYQACLQSRGMTTQEFLRTLNQNPQFTCGVTP